VLGVCLERRRRSKRRGRKRRRRRRMTLSEYYACKHVATISS
jgi:hypothetical protein